MSMIKCKRFWATTEHDSVHGNWIKGAVEHFNEWTSYDVEIISTHALANSHGCCQEIIVFYKTKETPINESDY